jgi:hypothetical protein
MSDEKTPGWNVYVDPSGDEAKRQIVETCPTNKDATDVSSYIKPRLPETDYVTTWYGAVVAPGGTFDRRLLREAQNDWPDDAMAPMKAIDI